jgi:hypothetical protein
MHAEEQAAEPSVPDPQPIEQPPDKQRVANVQNDVGQVVDRRGRARELKKDPLESGF